MAVHDLVPPPAVTAAGTAATRAEAGDDAAADLLREGMRLVGSGRLAEAALLGRRMSGAAPADWRGWLLRGQAELRARAVPAAARSFARALALGMDPLEAVEARWKTHMLLGDHARAWALSDAVLARRAADEFNRPWTPYHTRCVWNGTPLEDRRVLVRCYHGLGDSVQFIRYAAVLKARGCTVLVEAQPELLPLLARHPAIDRAVPLGEGDGLDRDAEVESMELFHACRCGPEAAAAVPYLDPGDAAPAPLPPADGGLRVGLVWRAGDWDPRRSLTTAELAPVLAVPGVSFVSLQRGEEEDRPPPALASDASSAGIDTLAATLRRLDLLLTVDTMAAHLAGALGVPAWVLLHAEADWRWGWQGARTPWYPGLRLFRQRRPGLWDGPVADVVRRLTAVARRRTGSR
ncbi:hypothetical protein [Rhodocista pekingensis]|uniref:Uncharacterized protein n=1 Tax=Rhodocista pekingensis TaxID=201185 RepID=A0ABW2KVX9_9PROT